MAADSATVFNIQRFSTEDGPGIRTTVFFKGCPLSCAWCHNPEGLRPGTEVGWKAATCIGCGDCIEVCPRNALSRNHEGLLRDQKLCLACGTCAEECATSSQELVGTEVDLAGLLAEVLKDRSFYETSGGGVTLSGGEPMLQHAFVSEFARCCKADGLAVALDTSGFAPAERLDAVLQNVDLVLFDLKLIDAKDHLRRTGVPLDRVLQSLTRVAESNLPVWVRTPVIPGITDSEDNLVGIAEHLVANLPRLERYDLLAFSNLCTAKYEMLGSSFSLADEPLLAASQMKRLADAVRRAGIDVVVWSGPTREQGSEETI